MLETLFPSTSEHCILCKIFESKSWLSRVKKKYYVSEYVSWVAWLKAPNRGNSIVALSDTSHECFIKDIKGCLHVNAYLL